MQNNFSKIPLLFSTIIFIFSFTLLLFFFRAIHDNNTESQLREGEWRNESLRRDGIKQLDYSVQIIEEDRAELENHFAKRCRGNREEV